MYVTCLTVMVCLLMCTVETRATGSPEDIVFRDIGVKIEKFGKSTSSENEILISVIVQFPNISSIGDIETSLLTPLVQKFVEKCSSSQFYKKVWEDNNCYYKNRTKEFLKSRRTLLKPFLTPIQNTSEEIGRPKKRPPYFPW